MSEMTKEQIEHARKLPVDLLTRQEVIALCDMATAFLDQGAQEAVGYVHADDLEDLDARGCATVYIRQAKAIKSLIPLYRHPAPTAELIEALREARDVFVDLEKEASPFSYEEKTCERMVKSIAALLARK